MRFTGSNLRRVRIGFDSALSDIQNMIATCPDPDDPEFAESFDAYLRERDEYKQLLARVDEAIRKETK
jgi:hypothetical protein